MVHGVHEDPDDIAPRDYGDDFAAPVGRCPRCPDGRPWTDLPTAVSQPRCMRGSLKDGDPHSSRLYYPGHASGYE